MSLENLLDRARTFEDEIKASRRWLHANPEISDELDATASFVAEKLREMGYFPREISKNGIIADLGDPRSGKTFLLRADMDALPIVEKTDLDFSSKNTNMHACGHDMHMAMLLGAARLLKERENELKGMVRLVFQPDEEGLTGARAMIAGGLLKEPEVSAAMAFHIWPGEIEAGLIAWTDGTIMSSQDRFKITIKGKGGHGARPELSIDPIIVGASIHTSLNEIIAREISAKDTAVLTVGIFKAGDAPNIIPETAILEGTLRTFDERTREFIKQRMVKISTLTAEKYRAECTIEFMGEIPALKNDAKTARELIKYTEELGIKNTYIESEMCSEDFAFIAQKVPSGYFLLGAGGKNERYKGGSLHNPTVVFNEDALIYGAAALAHGAIRWLEENA